MERMLISVIIPNYNYSQYIPQCLQSVLDSDFDPDNLEIIMVDDASTDESVKVIKKLMKGSRFPLRLIKNETNLGLILSRNRGIVNSRGEFLFFLDSDNYIRKDCIKVHYNAMMQNPDATACYAPILNFLNKTGEQSGTRSNQHFDYTKLLAGAYIDAMAMFRKTDLVEAGMYDNKMPPYGGEDYELWLRLGKMKKKVIFIDGEPLSFYRMHMLNMSQNYKPDQYNHLVYYLNQKYPTKLRLHQSETLDSLFHSNNHFAQLFYQTDVSSLNKENSLKADIRLVPFHFKLPAGKIIAALRFDPVNDYAVVKIKGMRFFNAGNEIFINPKIESNAIADENSTYFFSTTDPQITIEFDVPLQIDEVVIDVDCLKTGAEALIELQNLQSKKSVALEKLVTAMKATTEKNEADIERLIDEKNTYCIHYLETLNELTVINANHFIGGLIRMNSLFASVFSITLIRNVINKLQLSINTKTLTRSRLFDRQYYMANYPDVAGSGMTPEMHFLNYGWKEGRNPSSNFDTAFYLANNPDVLALRVNPLIHYIKKGQYENRQIKQSVAANTPINIDFETKKTMFQFLNRKVNAVSPHIAPPFNDFVLEIPFGFDDFEEDSPGTIAVFCHIYYTSLISEISSYLKNIPYPADLFITTDTSDKQQQIRENFKYWNKGQVVVEVVENRGRDIAPKLITWRPQYDNNDFCLHIHTKKSPHETVLNNWRQYLYENLLGFEKTVKSIFEAFRSDPQLGMIAPQHYNPARQFVGWFYNFAIAHQLAKRMNIALNEKGRFDFPSGSMFWARTAALKPLLEMNLRFDDFPEESGQTDSTPAHAIERLYFFACEKAGFKWIKIFDPNTTSYPQRSFVVKKRHDLTGFINQVQQKLLNEKGENQPEMQVGAKVEINQRLHFLKIQQNSPYAHLEPVVFNRALQLHIAGKESIIDFDEAFYLKANPDIESLVASGVYECGFIHFCMSGQKENRAWSNRLISSKFNLQPNYPLGMFEPVSIKNREHRENTLLPTIKGPETFMLILIPHLQKDLFYAGYNAFFNDFVPVFSHFSKIVIAVDSQNIENELATNYCSRVEVIKQSHLSEIKYSPDIIVCYSSREVNKALIICRNPEKIVYFCQEFESGFFPFGTKYIEAESAIAKSKNIIISSGLLRNFLDQENLLSRNNIFVTSPDIEVIDVLPEKTKKLFFYFRPEKFNTRNIPEIIWEAVHEFCSRHTGFELYLAGTIDTRFSVIINGNEVYVLSKLPKEDYIRLLSSCDVAVAMIYSAHPGVIPFQAAASGIPTITNIFKNRDEQNLRVISENFIPFDPVRENLCEKVEEALQKEKGSKHFNAGIYCGKPHSLSLTEYILKIVELQKI